MLWELERQFEKKGGTVNLGPKSGKNARHSKRTTLESFDSKALSDGSDGIELTFEDGSTVDARAIVLAMPKFAIQSLRKKGPVLDPHRAPHVPTLINSVEGIPLYKLFLVYDTPWWQEAWGLTQGRSLTDLPVRQCYYWKTNAGKPSAIMAYNDQASTSFWGGYQTGPLGPLDTRLDGDGAGPKPFKATYRRPRATNEMQNRRRENWDTHGAPHDMAMEMHRELMEMHGVTQAPDPIDAAFMDWMNPPYGGAVHFWNPGHKSWEIKDRMTQPVDGVNAFVVGEAWSTVQTWVEGAFQTSEIFLQKRMGMARPSWLAGTGGL
jgi:monoamine oxidase